MNDRMDKVQNAIFRAFCIREYLETQLTSSEKTVNATKICDWIKEKYPEEDISRQSVNKYLDVIEQYDDEKRKRYSEYSINSGLKKKDTKNSKYTYKKVLTTDQLSMLSELVYSSVFLDEETAIDLVFSLAEYDNIDGFNDKAEMNSVIRPFKGENFDAFSNLKLLHQAINQNRFISYYKGAVNEKGQDGYYKKEDNEKWTWNWVDKKNIKRSEEISAEKIPQNEHGKKILVCPYKIVWDNSRCYLIGLNQFNGEGCWQVRTFRIDRMYALKIIEEKECKNTPKNSPFYKEKEDFCFDVEKFMGSIFKMWAAEEKYKKLTFCVRKDKINIMRDRFGGIKLIPIENDEKHFLFETGIQVSNTFFSWLSGFLPDELRIVGPKEVKDEYTEHLKKICNGY